MHSENFRIQASKRAVVPGNPPAQQRSRISIPGRNANGGTVRPQKRSRRRRTKVIKMQAPASCVVCHSGAIIAGGMLGVQPLLS